MIVSHIYKNLPVGLPTFFDIQVVLMSVSLIQLPKYFSNWQLTLLETSIKASFTIFILLKYVNSIFYNDNRLFNVPGNSLAGTAVGR